MKVKLFLKFFLAVFSMAITAFLCYVLNNKGLTPLPLGKFLSPQQGFWQNAEPTDKSYDANFRFTEMKGKVNAYFDERMVPHIFAETDEDAYFVQGYLHAYFRLWQMDLQVRAAAGRVSEIVGEAGLKHDRMFRRLGMVYAAENSLAMMENDPETKATSDAYTAGVNAYIESLNESNLPLEYKLLGYYPEKWSNLKSSLFLKYMSYDLAGHENDFEMTNAKSWFSKSEFELLFPQFRDSMIPVVRNLDSIPLAGVFPTPPNTSDSIYLHFKEKSAYVRAQVSEQPNPENGSNNWALDSTRTASKAPILCNDPHLGLNLPSLWYEMQLHTPTQNVYGVSFPGSPGIMIGFNDSCAFGFTNGGRDVKDYYEIRFKDETRKQYWFDSSWVDATQRIETIRIAGKTDLLDTVSYTFFGPVMYDASYSGNDSKLEKNYAVRWTAHDSSNELKLFYLLDRTKNYEDYVKACSYLKTPGQNCIFASKKGDIAIRTAGRFPAKWNGQGDFVMPGFDSSYLWQYYIPDAETPYEHNPTSGFVSSANQRPVPFTYPYYLGTDYPSLRSYYLNQQLNVLDSVTIEDMKHLQSSNFSLLAIYGKKLLQRHLDSASITSLQWSEWKKLDSWVGSFELGSEDASVFDIWWKRLYHRIYDDEYQGAPKNIQWPAQTVLAEQLLKDSNYLFIDDANTKERESLRFVLTSAFTDALDSAAQIRNNDALSWEKYQQPGIRHLLKIPSFSHLNLSTGGHAQALNATSSDHGQSWRMIVHLTTETEAYGIYPGGQSGNPGSRYYDNFIPDWSGQKYFRLWMMKENEKNDSRIKAVMNFSS